MKNFDEDQFLITRHKLCRRHFLKLGMFALGTCIISEPAISAAHSLLSPERVLYLYNAHTGETLKTVYWREGEYVTQSLADINYILRDHYTNKTKPIDKRLLDLLYAISRRLNTHKPLHIISGYRAPSTNTYLRKYYGGVSKTSLHLYGKAADISLPGYRLSALRRAAINLKGGGVGYYPRKNFVHVDIGRIRYW